MSIDRLRALKALNDEKGLEMMQEAGRFAALASRHEDGTAPRAVSSFNLFQTPEQLAAEAVALVAHKLRAGARVLEPSAGLGRLYWAAREYGRDFDFVLVEESAECCAELYRMTERDERATLKQADFLSLGGNELGKFDAVIMNPPFKMGRDVKHITHATGLLKPDGVLVSFCYNGARQNAKLKPMADSWEVLPSGSFKSEGTRAEVALLTITLN